jgi:hypothetical protein
MCQIWTHSYDRGSVTLPAISAGCSSVCEFYHVLFIGVIMISESIRSLHSGLWPRLDQHPLHEIPNLVRKSKKRNGMSKSRDVFYWKRSPAGPVPGTLDLEHSNSPTCLQKNEWLEIYRTFSCLTAPDFSTSTNQNPKNASVAQFCFLELVNRYSRKFSAASLASLFVEQH